MKSCEAKELIVEEKAKEDIEFENYVIERTKCKHNFIYFLTNYVCVLEPSPGRGIIRFESWPHLIDVALKLLSNKLVIILKARQVGISWLFASYALWKILFFKGAIVLMLSKSEKDAIELLSKSKFIYGEMPPWLRLEKGADSLTEMGFPFMLSKIIALAATKDAARGITASVVIIDEADFHEYLDENYNSAKPTTDAGGQMILASTVNKMKLVTLFKSLYRGAKSNANNFIALFLGWQSRPGRDQEWYNRVEREAPDSAKLPKALHMEGEYPGNEAEALAPARAISAFDIDVLNVMRNDVRKPIAHIGRANIYQHYVVGRRYGAGSDTAHGVGADYSVTTLVDLQTGVVAADIISNSISPAIFAEESVTMLEEYRSPIWGIEDNDWGKVVIDKAIALKYKKIYHREKGMAREKVVGWHTDERNRYILWDELIDGISGSLIIIPSEEGLNQFYDVIRNPDKNGRIEAMSGGHDDYPTAVGIAWQMRKHSTGSYSGLKAFPFK